MKILQINSVYAEGSTGKITQEIHERLLADGFESVVIYGRGTTVNTGGVFRICGNIYARMNSVLSRITGIRYGGCFISTAKLLYLIRREKPDVVHLQCINGYFVNVYRLITWLKKNNIPTVLTLHAEFMYTANCGHAFQCLGWKAGCGNCPHLKRATKSWFLDRTHTSYQKMNCAFKEFDKNLKVVSVSPWLMKRAESSPILSGKSHRVILNGVDTNVFKNYDIVELKIKHCVQNRKIIFHATALFRDTPDDPKGGWYLLQIAKRMKSLPILFIVAGKYAIHNEIPDNLIFLGNICDQTELAKYYSMADLTVLTSKRETYSMVCAESLCCGTPVVGFCAGAPEMISLPQYSCFVPNGDLDALENCIYMWLTAKEKFVHGEIEKSAASVYAKDEMICQYENLYRGLL